MEHHVYIAAMWIFCLVGQAFIILCRAKIQADSDRNSAKSVRDVLHHQAFYIGARVFGAICLFGWWTLTPSIIGKLLIKVSPMMDFDLPLNPYTAGLFGLGVDPLLDKLMALAGWQKPLPPSQP